MNRARPAWCLGLTHPDMPEIGTYATLSPAVASHPDEVSCSQQGSMDSRFCGNDGGGPWNRACASAAIHDHKSKKGGLSSAITPSLSGRNPASLHWIQKACTSPPSLNRE